MYTTLCEPKDYTVHGILEAKILEWVAFPFSRGGLPNPRVEPRSPTLQADSLPAEPPGKPKNTGVGSLSLLQWIFPTQESNQGLLLCRRILYQLSYQGSPSDTEAQLYFSSAQFSRSVLPDSLRPHVLYSPWNSPDQSAGVGSLSLL